jgi:hypothetical protein
MVFHAESAERLARLADQVIASNVASAGLISAIAAESSDRCIDDTDSFSAQIDKLTKAGAWTDAALALIATELSRWKLRRLAYDEGEWHCALSRQRDLPEWLDEAIETSHHDLPLALLKAFVEAKRCDSEISEQTRSASVPRIRPEYRDLLCCDNFS